MAIKVIEKDLSGSYIFISFDLVNSTAFKLRDSNWPHLFNTFFDYCRLKTKSNFPNSYDWKMVGDEILFYLPVTNINEFIDAPKRVNQILNLSISFLNGKTKTPGILSVKAVVWSAYMKEQKNIGIGNIGVNYLIKSAGNLDFLGPHIDTGFRIGSYALGNRLVVGAMMAAIINSLGDSETRRKLRIISFEKLKGVWLGRRYPIVWYSDKWENLDDMFVYDERFVSPLVERIYRKGIGHIENIELISKVFDDLYKNGDIESLKLGIDEFNCNNSSPLIEHRLATERLSEVQLVALSFNEKHEMLIGLRIEDGRTIWDFGCSSLQMYQTIDESLEQGYFDDFGINLKKINNEYIPLSTYSYFADSEKKTIPGVMFLASVDKDSLLDINLNIFTYKKTEWITLSNLGKISENSAVPGFHATVRKAFSAYSKLIKK